MILPNGFYIIHQPKYKTPSVFDLHERGLFKIRPFVTKDWAYRVLANSDLVVKLQYLCLKEKAIQDPTTKERYSFHVKQALIDLNESLKLKSTDLAGHVTNQSILDEILAAHDGWCNSYIPLNENKKTDIARLKKKLLTSISERKKIIRKELVRKNSRWVNLAIPRLLQDFHRGLYLRVEDRLYGQYRRLGGLDSEKELIKKIIVFQRVYESDNQDLMRKPDGGIWKNEDEIWECWIGFAGTEEEAKRVCRTMETVFRPLVGEDGPKGSLKKVETQL